MKGLFVPMRMIIWMIYFWLYMLRTIPWIYTARRLQRRGETEKLDAFLLKRVTDWARRLLRLAGECARVYFCLHQWETPECGRIYLFYKKIRGKTVFLKEILDEPKFLWYDIRANGRYRSFFYAQKTIAMNREKAALQRN